MMSVDRVTPTNLTSLFFQVTSLHRPLDSEVSIILCWIGSAPVGLTGIGFQHGSIPK
jgi:hypothetical protein